MVVHIGFHKTGTTYLQKNIFPYLAGINYQNYKQPEEDPSQILTRESVLDLKIEKLKEKLLPENPYEGTVLYSNERLVGPAFYFSGINKKEIADNLYAVGAKKVIISIRNQVSYLDSIYRQYVQEGGVMNISKFFDGGLYSYNINHCNYYNTISYYASLFGKDNLLIIVNEELRRKEPVVIERIERFLNCKYIKPKKSLNPHQNNKSISDLSVKALRVLNHFTYSIHKPNNLISDRISTWKFRYLFQRFIDPLFISKISGKKYFLNRDQISYFKNFYAKGNSKLEREFGLELSKYGYPVESKPESKSESKSKISTAMLS